MQEQKKTVQIPTVQIPTVQIPNENVSRKPNRKERRTQASIMRKADRKARKASR